MQNLLKTPSEKLLILLWFLILALVIGISAYGWNIGDLNGGILMGFLPASLITVISTATAVFIKSSISKLSKYVWLAVSVAALLAAIFFASRPLADAIEGAETLLAYVMMILSFPFGLFIPYFLMATASLWKEGGDIVNLCIMWFCFFLFGYLQWFWLLPLLYKKWSTR